MKLAKALFFLIALCVFSQAKAQTSYGLNDFLRDFSEEYNTFSAEGGDLLKETQECLKDQFQKSLCRVHQLYLKTKIHDEVKKYRINLALTRWSRYYLAGVEKSLPFEADIQRFHKTSAISALSPAELKTAQFQFQEKLNGIIMIWKEELQEVRGYQVEKSQAVEIVEKWPMTLWFRTQNIFLSKLKMQIEKQIFGLSKMRILNQLAHHPILAYISSEEPSNEELLKAVNQIALNLRDNTNDINEIIKLVRVDYDLDSLLDSMSIVIAVKNKHPESADYIDGLIKSYQRRQLIGTVLMIGGSLALMVMAPPAISLTSMTVLQSWMLYNDTQKMELTQKQFLTSTNRNYVQGHMNKYLSAQADYETDVVAMPLLLIGVPLLRVSKLVRAVAN